MITITQKKNRIPSREEFHREFAGVITVKDFDTTYGNPRRHNPPTQLELENMKNLSPKTEKEKLSGKTLTPTMGQ